MCERQASGLLTLKNCAEVLQVANDYSAQQLVRSANQFICQNLAALLESKSLDLLSEECIDKLTRYYFDSFPTLYHRKITPYSDAPTSETLENINITIAEVFNMETELELAKQQTSITKPDDYTKKTKINSNRNRRRNSSGDGNSSGDDKIFEVKKGSRRRNRKSSCESITSVGSSGSEEDINAFAVTKGKDLEVEDFELIERKQDPPFIKVQDKRDQQRKSSEFVTSLLGLPNKSKKPNIILETPRILKAPLTPEDLNKYESKSVLQSSSSNRMVKFTKISQKERKRLSSETQPSNTNVDETSVNDKPKWLGWCNKSPGSINQQPDSSTLTVEQPVDMSSTVDVSQNTSLQTIMQSQKIRTLHQEKIPKSTETSKTKQGNKKPKSWRTLDLLNEAPIIQKPAPMPSINPWHKENSQESSNINPPISSPYRNSPKNVTLNDKPATFQDIMHQEVLEKQNLHRAQSKSLAVTQLEERAIQELKLFYNVDNIFDELITVDRANTSTLATPVWNPRRNL